MLIDLLFLIVLATIAHQSKRPILSSILFGLLKAISIYFIRVCEHGESASNAVVVSGNHLIINSFLGFAIAFIVTNHSENPKIVASMTILSIISFLTHIASLSVVNIFSYYAGRSLCPTFVYK